MKKLIKVYFLVATALMVLSCSGNNNNAQSGRLQIAVEESYAAYFEQLAAEFSKDRDVQIRVVKTPMFDVLDSLAIQKGSSADIFMIVNDRIGNLAEQRLIEPLNFSLVGYTDNATMASTYRGNPYMVPMSTDTTLLIYNKAKVSNPPTYLSQLNPSDWAAKFTDFYHSAGLFSSKGGYIFDANQNLGLNNAGSVQAGEIMQQLYNSGASHWQLMKDDTVSYNVMMKAFADGEISYMINGPWALADIAKFGIDAGMIAIPSWDGSHPYRALTGTKGMGVNAYSRNKELAIEFVQFLASQEHAQLWFEMTEEVAPHTGVIYPEGSLQQISFNATADGLSMPNIPAFAQVWDPMRDALIQIANGGNVQQALDAARNIIERNISDLGM